MSTGSVAYIRFDHRQAIHLLHHCPITSHKDGSRLQRWAKTTSWWGNVTCTRQYQKGLWGTRPTLVISRPWLWAKSQPKLAIRSQTMPEPRRGSEWPMALASNSESHSPGLWPWHRFWEATCYDPGLDFSGRLLTSYDYGTPQASSHISHGQSSQSAG